MIRFLLSLFLFSAQILFLPHSYADGLSQRDLRDFETLPILHEGRVKPMSSFADVLLKRFSGQDQVPNQTLSSSAWLAQTLFNPTKATETQIFKVEGDDLKARLGLPPSEQIYYSLSEIASAIDATKAQALAMTSKPRDTLNKEQIALLNLHEHVLVYQQLLRALSALNPLPTEIRAVFDLDEEVSNYVEIKQAVTQSETADLSSQAAFLLQTLEKGGEQSDLFRVIPRLSLETDVQIPIWLSPWSSLLQGAPTEVEQDLIKLWAGLASTYEQGHSRAWRENLRAIHTELESLTDANRLEWEHRYNEVEPYFWSAVFYGLALVFICLWVAFSKRPMFYRPALLCFILAVIAHIGGIFARIAILERPPVGTLYESALFVGVVVTIIAAIMEWRRRNGFFLSLGAVTGALLLSFAPQLIPQADSKPVLMAVLNSGFWLGTHVLVITAGYGVAILAGCLAHGMMVLRNPEPYKGVLHMILIAALSLTTIGTILGGIWADQSWGRFWGWDPKENGALLIVLWIVWLLHGRLSGDLKGSSYLAAIAGLNIIVVLAWFGVNFLGVGLHSYGFIEGIGYPLAVFILAEILVIYGLYCYSIKRVNREKHP